MSDREKVLRFPVRSARKEDTPRWSRPPAMTAIFTGNGAVVVGGERQKDGSVRTFGGFVPCDFPVKDNNNNKKD